jgi:chemotaxis protein histidine kinase CheA
VTPEARTRAPFELLRFTAAPVTGALVVLELDGRFRSAGRFARHPLLVVEPGGDRRRLELAPVRTVVDGQHWHGEYAVPAEALGASARLALGLRGTLLELPAPDELGDGERLATLAREANGLRRALEAAEAEAAAAREQAAAAEGRLEEAVAAARAEAAAASAERIDALEHEVVETHRLSARDVEEARTTAIADVTARAEAAEQHAEDAETWSRAAEEALQAAQARAEAAEAARAEAEERAQVAEAARAEAEERAQLAEQAAGDAVAATSAAEGEDLDDDAALTAEMAASIDAQARAAEAEQEVETLRERLKAAEAGTDVLRTELAEERERLAELAEERDEAIARAEALGGGAVAEGLWTPSAGRGDDEPHEPEEPDDPDVTRPFPVAPERDADADVRRRAGIFDPLPADAPEHRRHGPNLSPWIAVGALLLFVLAVVLLLFGG